MDIPIVKTEIPSPLPQHASEPHLPVDGNYLHSLLNRFLIGPLKLRGPTCMLG